MAYKIKLFEPTNQNIFALYMKQRKKHLEQENQKNIYGEYDSEDYDFYLTYDVCGCEIITDEESRYVKNYCMFHTAVICEGNYKNHLIDWFNDVISTIKEYIKKIIIPFKMALKRNDYKISNGLIIHKIVHNLLVEFFDFETKLENCLVYELEKIKLV